MSLWYQLEEFLQFKKGVNDVSVYNFCDWFR